MTTWKRVPFQVWFKKCKGKWMYFLSQTHNIKCLLTPSAVVNENMGTQTLLITFLRATWQISIHLHIFLLIPSSQLQKSIRSGQRKISPSNSTPTGVSLLKRHENTHPHKCSQQHHLQEPQSRNHPSVPQQNVVCPREGILLSNKGNEVLRHAPTWMNLENTWSKEASHIWFHLSELSRAADVQGQKADRGCKGGGQWLLRDSGFPLGINRSSN